MLKALILFFAITPLLPFLPIKHWSVRFFDFIRLQSLCIQIILLVVILYLWGVPSAIQWGFVLILIASLLYQFFLILPYTALQRTPQVTGNFNRTPLKLITANVLQTNTQYDLFINEVKRLNPHIFITMESDKNWDRAISSNLPSFKHTHKVSLSNFYGMHLYSQIPIEVSEVKYLIQEDIPSLHTTVRFNDQKLHIISLHPAPPSPTENDTSKERDAELILVGKLCRELPYSTIVCGDLNDVVWSNTSTLFKKMTGFLDPRVGKGLYPTFHARYWLFRFPLDHLFYSTDLDVPVLKRLRPIGSDHFGMYYEVRTAQKKENTTNPSLSSSDRNKVQDIISEGMNNARE